MNYDEIRPLLDKLPKRPCPHCAGKGKVDDPAQIGQWFRRARIKAGISAAEMSHRLGFSRRAAYVLDMEAGRRSFNEINTTAYLEVINNGHDPSWRDRDTDDET